MTSSTSSTSSRTASATSPAPHVRGRHTWVPAVAALAGTAWVIEVTLILASEDGLPEGPLVGLYFAGILLALAAAVGTGLRQAGVLRRVGVALACCLLLALWLMGNSALTDPLLSRITDREYVLDEVPVLLGGLVLLALAWRARAHDLRRADA